MLLDKSLRDLAHWAAKTALAEFMGGWWQWPVAESIHFIGLSLLIGAIGFFDLRLIGVGRSIPISSLHRLIPWGVAGYTMNFLTGICFLSNAPDQYMYNPSFHVKLYFMAAAGINVLLFYTTMFRKVLTLGPGENAPLPARIMGAVSLISWLGVIAGGRLITFFRPPFHWCEWC